MSSDSVKSFTTYRLRSSLGRQRGSRQTADGRWTASACRKLHRVPGKRSAVPLRARADPVVLPAHGVPLGAVWVESRQKHLVFDLPLQKRKRFAVLIAILRRRAERCGELLGSSSDRSSSTADLLAAHPRSLMGWDTNDERWAITRGVPTPNLEGAAGDSAERGPWSVLRKGRPFLCCLGELEEVETDRPTSPVVDAPRLHPPHRDEGVRVPFALVRLDELLEAVEWEIRQPCHVRPHVEHGVVGGARLRPQVRDELERVVLRHEVEEHDLVVVELLLVGRWHKVRDVQLLPKLRLIRHRHLPQRKQAVLVRVQQLISGPLLGIPPRRIEPHEVVGVQVAVHLKTHRGEGLVKANVEVADDARQASREAEVRDGDFALLEELHQLLVRLLRPAPRPRDADRCTGLAHLLRQGLEVALVVSQRQQLIELVGQEGDLGHLGLGVCARHWLLHKLHKHREEEKACSPHETKPQASREEQPRQLFGEGRPLQALLAPGPNPRPRRTCCSYATQSPLADARDEAEVVEKCAGEREKGGGKSSSI
eukprot:scaffold7696_cov258-Pinguiococcus_pyrenoidosus.AAC.3